MLDTDCDRCASGSSEACHYKYIVRDTEVTILKKDKKDKPWGKNLIDLDSHSLKVRRAKNARRFLH